MTGKNNESRDGPLEEPVINLPDESREERDASAGQSMDEATLSPGLSEDKQTGSAAKLRETDPPGWPDF